MKTRSAKAGPLARAGAAATITLLALGVDLVIVHRSPGEFHAVHRRCTHGGHQPLSHIKAREVLQCNGFNHSIFGLDGAVLKGPAPAPVKSFPAEVIGERLEITL